MTEKENFHYRKERFLRVSDKKIGKPRNNRKAGKEENK